MQHLDHDMDELFQKAAEEYQLKNESDWEKIAPRIPTANSTGSARQTNAKWKKYLPAVLLLFMVLLVSDIIIRTTGRSEKPEANSHNRENPISKRDYTDDRKSLEPSIKSYEKNKIVESTNDYDVKNLITEKQNNRSSLAVEPYSINPAIVQSGLDYESYPINFPERQVVSTITLKNEIDPQIGQRNSPPVTFSLQKTDPFNKRSYGFYWGVLAGPQLNEVKQQGMTKTGLSIGIPVGYRLNNLVSVESGIFYSTKYYYSDGKYFNMSKPDPGMPSNMTVMDLEGKSNVLEIPLKFKLDVLNKQRNSFFVTSGFSSYLMTKENNNYHAMVNGTPEYMVRTYKETNYYTAASLEFSTGIEHLLSNKKSSIRIEPYLQIPLKGIGVGAMPVTSAGIHIGITTGNKK